MNTGTTNKEDSRSTGIVLRLNGTEQGLSETPSDSHERCFLKMRSSGKLNPTLKDWIDNVIVPALIEQWISSKT
jgi:hypothetical protein